MTVSPVTATPNRIAKIDAMTGDPYSIDHGQKEAMLRLGIQLDRVIALADEFARRADRDHPSVPIFCNPPDGTDLSVSAQLQFQVANVNVPIYYILVQNTTSDSIYIRFNRMADATGIVIPSESYYESEKIALYSLGIYAPSGGTLNAASGIIVEGLTTEYAARISHGT